MNSNTPELLPPTVAATVAASAAACGYAAAASTTTTASTSIAAATATTTATTAASLSIASSSTATANDANLALITPTKLATNDDVDMNHVKKDKKRQLQLQLTTTGKSSGWTNNTDTTTTTTTTTTTGATMMMLHDSTNANVDSSSSSSMIMTTNTAPTASSAPPPPPPPSLVTVKWPPVSSTKALPPLSGRILDLSSLANEDTNASSSSAGGFKKGGGIKKQQQQQRNVIEFEVNQECTSIGLVPSGRLAVAGFTDGTLRLFDLTGHFAKDKNHPQTNSSSSGGRGVVKDIMTSNGEDLFDDDASTTSSSFQEEEEDSRNTSFKSKAMVDSHSNQRYGAVACQIHARGVHTSLLMDVAISEDGLYAFGGVQRGSVELVAVYLGDVENYFDERSTTTSGAGKQPSSSGTVEKVPGLLDLIHVDRHADAKLKGFGACTRLWNGWERARNGVERPEYLLFTGKGIKNIHIWSYRPSRLADNTESVWTCLYDTQTNGTSITQLYFRHNAHGMLQGISKSDYQKLRVWDLSYEQRRITNGSDESDRPKRPEYVDVASTEGTIGVCGPYAFASGSLGGMPNIINVVGLDADDVSSPFNCTELALPVDVGGDDYAVNRHSRTGRQQRGDLKSVVNVAGLVFDASHALLQLSDGSVVHYLHDQSGHPMLLQTPPSLCITCVDDDLSLGGSPVGLNQNKKMTLARVGSQGMVLFAVSSFNENTSRGAIMLRALPGSSTNGNGSKSFWRYWGFNGLKRKRKQHTPGGPSAATMRAPVAASVAVETTPIPVAKSQMNSTTFRALQTIAEVDTNNRRKSPANEVVDYTPIPLTKCDNTNNSKNAQTVRKVTPGDPLTTTEPIVDPIVKDDKSSRSNKKRRSEDEHMDIQLQSIVYGYNSEAAHTPKRTDGDAEQSSARVLVHSNRNEFAQTHKQNATPMIVKRQKTTEQGKEQVAIPVAEKSLLTNSPKRRGGKSKIEPSQSTDVVLSTPDEVVVQPAEHVPIIKKVGFLGVTILDRRVGTDLPESCFQPKQRPALLVEQLPRSTVDSRLAKYATGPNSNSSQVATSSTQDVQFKLHCDERHKLAARHRAEHEMIRKKVLHSIRYVVSTWDIELNSNRSHASIVESAKKWFDKALKSHEEVLNDMLFRQEMEAESLAARQTSELDNERAPVLLVSFPFPQVFEQARQELIAILQ